MSELTEYSPNRMLLESVVSPLWPCEPLQPYANETPWTPSPPYTQAAIDRTHTPTLTPARLPGGVHSPLTHPSPPPKLTLFSFRSSPVEWCNRFVSFGLGYALSWSGVSSCPVGCGVSRDLVRMSRLR